LKLVLEIVTVVVTFAIMGGSGLANWFAYDAMVADLNRNLSPGNKIPVIFARGDSRAAFFSALEQHRVRFPESELRRRFFGLLIVQAISLGLLGLELGLFKTFHPLP
jgi:hypothetical protein